MLAKAFRGLTAAIFVTSSLTGCGTETPSLEDLLAGSSLQVETPADGTLTGTVGLDGFGNCEGISIKVSGPDYTTTTTTKSGGEFELTQLAAGAYQFTFSAPDFDALEELVVYETREPMDVGTFTLSPETVPISGNVSLSDGENPAGSVVSVSGETEMQVPDGVVCTSDEDSFSDVFDSTVLTDGSGRYETRVPRSARAARARAERGDYTSGEVEIPSDDLAGADDDNPVELGEVILYPLTGFVNIVGGKIQPSATITLQISAFNAGEVVIAEVPEGDACEGYGAYQSFDAEVDYTVSGDGEYTICVKARNAAGDEVEFTRDVLIDTTAPEILSFRIADGGDYVQAAAVALSVQVVETGSGAATIRIEDDGASSGELPFGDTVAHTLVGGPGSHTLEVYVTDKAGHVNGPITATVSLDLDDPNPPTVSLNATDAKTSERTVDVSLTFTSGDEEEMQLSESSGFGGASWVSVTDETSFQLSTGEGSKTLFVRVRDASGRMSGSGQDSIVLDTSAPGLPTISLDSGAGETSDLNIDIALGNLGDATEMILGNDASFSGKSWEAAIPNTVYTLPAGDGVKTVYVKTRDDVGNESDVNSSSIILDTDAPGSPQISIDGGATYTQDADVVLSLFSSGADEMRISEASDFSGGTGWIAYSSSYAYTILGGQGDVTIYAEFRDDASNTAGPVSAEIHYDGNPPSSGSGIAINNNDTYTTSRSVEITLDIPGDATEIIVANNVGFAGVSWQSATATIDWDLTSSDGSKIVYAKWRDVAGNETGIQSSSIELDTEAPTPGSPAILLDGGKQFSSAAVSIPVMLSASDGPYWMELSDSQSFDSPLQSTYYTETTWVSVPATDGTTTIYVRFQDEAGNWSESRSDSIDLDRTAPTLSGLTANQGNAYTRFPDIELQLSAYDDNPLVEIEISEDDFGSSEMRPFQPQLMYQLQAAEGVSVDVSVRIRDAAGNWSSPQTSQSITLDQTAPIPGSPAILINGGALRTNQASSTLTINSGDADEMRLANNPGFTGGFWQPVTDEQGWILSGADGDKKVFVQFRDEAGNTTPHFSAEITLDTTPPLGAGISIAEMPVTSATTWTVNIAAGDANVIYLSEESDFGSSVQFGPMPNTEYVLTDTSNGNRTLYAKFCDLTGNCTGNIQQNRTLDTEAPYISSLRINNGAGKTADMNGNVTLNLFAGDTTGGSGIVGVRLGNSLAQAQSAPPQPYEQTKVWTLGPPTGNGVDQSKTVWAIYHDAANNQGPVTSATIRYDRVPPAGTISFDAAVTNDSLAGVTLTYDPDTAEMKLSYGQTCAGGSWASVTSEALWPLSLVNGAQYISVRYRDDVGNEGNCFNDSINLDTIGPAPNSFSVAGNAGALPGYSNEVTLTANASAAADPTGCNYAEIAEDVSFLNPVQTANCGDFPYDYELANQNDGTKSIYLRFYDNLGNAGAITQQTITLDRSVPTFGISGGFTIAQGDFTNTANITLQLDASGATRVRYGQGAGCGFAPVVYSTTKNLTLTGGNGQKTVSLRYLDDAGNESACFARSITLDTVIGSGWSITVTGIEGRNDKSANVNVTVTLNGVDPDVVEMQVSNLTSFADASWISFEGNFDWILPTGDSNKTIYVKVRDAAGNQSSKTGSIILDQTAPDPPSLQLFDLTADGYYVSENSVEMQWSIPAGTSNFELQGFILGVNDDFVVLEPSLSAVQDSYTYSVTRPGNRHQFRIRARDDIGNESSWSIVVEASPFRPITEVVWIRADGAYLYYFFPESGTFSLNTDFYYENQTGTVTTIQLAENTTDWQRPEPSSFTINETFEFRTANQDNSLVFDSIFPSTHLNSRQVVDTGSVGRYTSIAQDSTGKFHISHYYVGGHLYYVYGDASGWEHEVIDTEWISGLYTSIVVDSQDRPHISYHKNGDALKYAYKDSGIWSTYIIDDLGSVGQHGSLAIDGRDAIHISYRDTDGTSAKYAFIGDFISTEFEDTLPTDIWPIISGAVTTTIAANEPSGFYALNLRGSHFIETTATATLGQMIYAYAWQRGGAGNGGETPDAGEFLRLQYWDGVAWQTLEQHSNVDGSTIVFTSVTGTVPAAAQKLRFVNTSVSACCDDFFVDDFQLYSTPSTPSTTVVDDGGGNSSGWYTSIAVDSNNKAHMTYYDQTDDDVYYASSVTGFWNIVDIGESGSAFGYNSIAIDSQDVVHISYANITGTKLRHADNLSGSWVIEDVDTGAGNWVGWHSSLYIDAEDNLHIAHWDFNSADLRYSTNKSGSWSNIRLDTVGDVGKENDLVVDSFGKVHISYYDHDNNQLKYLSYTDSDWVSWETEVIPDPGTLHDHASLAIDKDGLAHVVYSSVSGTKLRYASNRSGNWMIEDADTGGTNWVGWYASIDLDPSGFAHVAHYDFDDDLLRYSTNASGSWASEVVDDGGDGPDGTDVGEKTEIAVDENGKSHIVYYDRTNDDLKYATNASGSWVTTVVDSSGSTGDHPSIALDANGKVHISYYDLSGVADLNYANNLTGSWSIEKVPSVGSGTDGLWGSIAVDSEGGVHIAHVDLSLTALAYAYKSTSGSWQSEIVDNDGNISSDVAIYTDSNNTPHVAYRGADNLRYAVKLNGNWISSTIDSDTNDIGLSPAIRLDGADIVHIVYVDQTDDEVEYTYGRMSGVLEASSTLKPPPFE